jgi:uncharacterized protein YlxP (DUF503 family)
MLWLQRISLNLNNILQRQKEVAQTKQRKHTFTQANTTFGVNAMSQARVLTERELRKVLNYCSTQPHATRNRAMLLCTHMAGMRVPLQQAVFISATAFSFLKSRNLFRFEFR